MSSTQRILLDGCRTRRVSERDRGIAFSAFLDSIRESAGAVTIGIGRRRFTLERGTLDEIVRVSIIYDKMKSATQGLVRDHKPNAKAPLLLKTAGQGGYEARDGRFVHKQSWCVSCVSLVGRQVGRVTGQAIFRAYQDILSRNQFLREGVNFLPQRRDTMHFHIAVGREVTAPIPSDEQKARATDMFKGFVRSTSLEVKQPQVVLAGLFVAPDGTLILKAYPLDGSILAFRQRMEEHSLEVDNIFDDNNKGTGARKPQPGRLYHVCLGRLTNELSPEQFKQFVETVERYGEKIFGIYRMPESYLVVEGTSYFQDPISIEAIPFGR